MNLKVIRRYKKQDYTISDLYIDGTWFSNVLEDTDRGLTQSMSTVEIQKKKIYGKTAIPTGIYLIDMNTVSSKFKSRTWAKPFNGKLPRLIAVKGFEGVLIHVGNSCEDTLGCLLVGLNKVKGKVTESTVTFTNLMNKYLLPAYHRGEKITLEIV